MVALDQVHLDHLDSQRLLGLPRALPTGGQEKGAGQLILVAMEPPAKRRSLTRHPTVDRSAAEAMMKKGQAETLTGISFKDGSLLEELARQHVIAFKEVLPEYHKPFYGPLCVLAVKVHTT